jgi:4-hydroxy-3-polyprenylbenzoate decarboxylase
MGLDGTRKLPEEGFARDWPKVMEMDEGTKRKMDALWARLPR